MKSADISIQKLLSKIILVALGVTAIASLVFLAFHDFVEQFVDRGGF